MNHMLLSAVAAGRRMHPMYVLPAALLLCSLLLLLHSQHHVHDQLRAAHQDLEDLKHAVSGSAGHAAHGTRGPSHLWASSSSSSSSSSSGLQEQNKDELVQQLMVLVQEQQKVLNSLPKRNRQLSNRAQEFADKANSILAPLQAMYSSDAAAMQHHRPTSGASVSAVGGSSVGVSPVQSQQGFASLKLGSNATAAAPPGTLCLDLTEFLGINQYFAGITWEPKSCYSGLSMIFKDPSDQKTLRAKILKDLTTTMASVRGVPVESINTTAPWWASIKGQAPALPKTILSDPTFNEWQGALLDVLSRYLLMMDTKAPALLCPSGGDASAASPAAAAGGVSAKAMLAGELPMAKCTNRTPEALMQQIGRHSTPFNPLTTIADGIMVYGLCTVPDREGYNSYGDFMLGRAMNSKWRTFKTRTLEEDAVVFLWDILYQARGMFLKQSWLGVAAMQQPFDFLAISDIIYEIQPDVVLETGTANGGSALMWASILELNGLTNSSVITVDIQKPGVTGAFGADPPAAVSAVMTANGQVVMMPRKRPQQNPVKHPLWNKYVTFVEGSSVDPATITKVKGLLQQKQHALWRSDAEQSRGSSSPSATNTTESGVGGSISTNERHITSAQRPMRVLVLLDSHHAAAHVLTEMESYCPLVSAGSFCVIEDTKLTRWTNSDPGPMASVQSFLAWHPEFAVDRDRELLFTHHPYGYLQRLY